MNEQYLWDRSGAPDAEIAELEAKLGTLAWCDRPGTVETPGAWSTPRPHRGFRTWAPAAIAAALLIVLAGWMQRQAVLVSGATPWEVVEAQGSFSAAGTRVLRGQLLRTGPQSRLTLHADRYGRLDLERETELEVLGGGVRQPQFRLQRGTLRAFIWAAPEEFVIDTPSARAIDLGCVYTLSVDETGGGALRVQAGWVAFQHQNRESFIPAGAACRVRPGKGPGVPVYEASSEGFRQAVLRWEEGDPTSMPLLLTEARHEDGLTLWHLLAEPELPPQVREKVLDRFAELVSLPPSLPRESVLSMERSALDSCWNALELDNADWWRRWKRDWTR
jgi:hypothetical protein